MFHSVLSPRRQFALNAPLLVMGAIPLHTAKGSVQWSRGERKKSRQVTHLHYTACCTCFLIATTTTPITAAQMSHGQSDETSMACRAQKLCH